MLRRGQLPFQKNDHLNGKVNNLHQLESSKTLMGIMNWRSKVLRTMTKFIHTIIVFVLATFSISIHANSEGEAMYGALGCASCHGENGRSNDEAIPSLAGKDIEWIIQQLEYFQSGQRQNSYMNAMAPTAEGFERSIAEYLSIQDPQR